ncbi:hypothetical protein BVX94_00890, partial [bacterium B17]
IYIEHLGNEIHKLKLHLAPDQKLKYLAEFKENLLEGIAYYRDIATDMIDDQRENFLEDLTVLNDQIEKIFLPAPAAAASK